MSQSNPASNYHHGDLRNALILAATELIEERGSIEFSIAEAARRAGVSSGAPYRHFKDKEALLVAVAELGFMGLQQAIEEAIAPLPLGSIERIIASGHAYMRYVIEKHAYYDLMWGESLADYHDKVWSTEQTGDALTLSPSIQGFNQLVDLVQEWVNAEGLSMSAREIAVKLLATGHGLVGLHISRRLHRLAPGLCVYDCLTSSAYTFLNGVKEQQGAQSMSPSAHI